MRRRQRKIAATPRSALLIPQKRHRSCLFLLLSGYCTCRCTSAPANGWQACCTTQLAVKQKHVCAAFRWPIIPNNTSVPFTAASNDSIYEISAKKQLIWLGFPYLPFLNHDQLGKAECCSLDRFFFFFPASILLAKISVILQPWAVFSSWDFLSLLHSALDSGSFLCVPHCSFCCHSTACSGTD